MQMGDIINALYVVPVQPRNEDGRRGISTRNVGSDI
jgi:hypothetical protein